MYCESYEHEGCECPAAPGSSFCVDCMSLEEAQELYADIIYVILTEGSSRREIVENLMYHLPSHKVRDLIYKAAKKAE